VAFLATRLTHLDERSAGELPPGELPPGDQPRGEKTRFLVAQTTVDGPERLGPSAGRLSAELRSVDEALVLGF
jgi:hypothetical protein